MFCNVTTVDFNSSPSLIGSHIHGNDLFLVFGNSISVAGVSLHWHGFEMKDPLPYNSDVRNTQCLVSLGNSFAYKFTVNKIPSIYWYHIYSGNLRIDAYDALKGPLIVHPLTSIYNVDVHSCIEYVNDEKYPAKLALRDATLVGRFSGKYLEVWKK